MFERLVNIKFPYVRLNYQVRGQGEFKVGS